MSLKTYEGNDKSEIIGFLFCQGMYKRNGPLVETFDFIVKIGNDRLLQHFQQEVIGSPF